MVVYHTMNEILLQLQNIKLGLEVLYTYHIRDQSHLLIPHCLVSPSPIYAMYNANLHEP